MDAMLACSCRPPGVAKQLSRKMFPDHSRPQLAVFRNGNENTFQCVRAPASRKVALPVEVNVKMERS